MWKVLKDSNRDFKGSKDKINKQRKCFNHKGDEKVRGRKTKCNLCTYSKNSATKDPCNTCNEIQVKSVKNSDKFILAGEKNE